MPPSRVAFACFAEQRSPGRYSPGRALSPTTAHVAAAAPATGGAGARSPTVNGAQRALTDLKKQLMSPLKPLPRLPVSSDAAQPFTPKQHSPGRAATVAAARGTRGGSPQSLKKSSAARDAAWEEKHRAAELRDVAEQAEAQAEADEQTLRAVRERIARLQRGAV